MLLVTVGACYQKNWQILLRREECLAQDQGGGHAESNTDPELDKLDLAPSCNLHNKTAINIWSVDSFRMILAAVSFFTHQTRC